MNKSFVSAALVAMVLLQSSGCAAVTALKHADKKNLGVLSQGTSRENVVAYLGAPVTTEITEGVTTDIYKFKQGFSGGNKAIRALFHGVMDFFTIFIWEVIGWPAEVMIDGTDMTVKVVYDKEKTIQDVVFLQS